MIHQTDENYPKGSKVTMTLAELYDTYSIINNKVLVINTIRDLIIVLDNIKH